MKNIIMKIAMLFIFVVGLNSCYPDNDISSADLDTITTLYEADDFVTAPTSVTINWSVSQLKGDDGDDIPYYGAIDDEILNTTLENLVALYGVSNVYILSETAQPDPVPSNSDVVVITPTDVPPVVDALIASSIILRKNTSSSIIYPPCYPGYWGWYCPPPIISVNSYSVGTVILDMVEVGETDASWSGFMRGLLSSNESSNSRRTINTINQAFSQSPYLK
ncbi:MAG: DUF4136 domain-containing protein [Flavobacteriaceae bacterium]|nr:DUF4136 domain-containing protein [Flavobacteriaceae bacterium]